MIDMIREATPQDLPEMEALAVAKRERYRAYQPQFWNVAVSAERLHQEFLQAMMARPNVFALVWAEEEAGMQGFLVCSIGPTPPVYDAGGPTAMVDDFCVKRPQDWSTVGQKLLDEAAIRARRDFGAAQLVVVTGHKDELKRAMLAQSASLASEWYVRPT